MKRKIKCIYLQAKTRNQPNRVVMLGEKASARKCKLRRIYSPWMAVVHLQSSCSLPDRKDDDHRSTRRPLSKNKIPPKSRVSHALGVTTTKLDDCWWWRGWWSKGCWTRHGTRCWAMLETRIETRSKGYSLCPYRRGRARSRWGRFKLWMEIMEGDDCGGTKERGDKLDGTNKLMRLHNFGLVSFVVLRGWAGWVSLY